MSATKWTKQRVIDRIKEWHRKGIPVREIWRYDPTLRGGSYLCFGSWREAQAAAGFQPAHETWSKERVVDEIRRRFPNGLPANFRWKDHSRLTCAARVYFGSWHDALVAAGLRQGKRKVRRPWTRQRVVAAIRARHDQGLPLRSVWREDKSLYHFAQKTFGSWRLAMAAAGFPLPPTRQWTKEGVIRAIRSRRERGVSLVGVEKADHPLYSAARRHFGSWGNALQAAGSVWTPYRRWSRQSVLYALVDWQERGRPLSRVWVEDRGLFAAAHRYFGNWSNTLQALGASSQERGGWFKERVILELQAWYRQAGDRPRFVGYALSNAATRLFGSLDEAMEAAGVKPKEHKWSRRRVITAIQDGYVHGRPIEITRFGDRRLADAAERWLGGWYEAVAAAGLPGKYTKPRPKRRWNREAVVTAIRARQRQGLPLKGIAKRDSGLYQAATKYLGGWYPALAAAGIACGEESK